ncbi:MAG: histidinol dehydrogenase [Calditrichaceae bacterium]
MQIIEHPERAKWPEMLRRPVMKMDYIYGIVRPILADIKKNGDSAVKKYIKKFDGEIKCDKKVEKSEILDSQNQLSDQLKSAIHLAASNIKKFHQAQLRTSRKIETWPGVTCWRKQLPIEKVGLYIPGGTAPLFSTLLMLGIPAQIAGCKEIILCTPADKNGQIHPAVLYAAEVVGLEKIYKIGGAQAIAAMAYGTETISRVYKIFGPGNQYVTSAKQLITLDGIAIDMPAGPSEVLILADDTAEPEFIASDLLSQAEHGADSQVILVSNSMKLIENVQKSIDNQLKSLLRKDIAEQSLKNSKAFLIYDLEDAMDLINTYAPEHLILNVQSVNPAIKKVKNVGSVFIGPYTPESAGDYASGTNHTLPTNGYALNYSGVSLDSFMKQVTFQQIDKKGLKEIGWAIEEMAATETLTAHKNAVSIRLAKIERENEND